MAGLAGGRAGYAGNLLGRARGAEEAPRPAEERHDKTKRARAPYPDGAPVAGRTDHAGRPVAALRHQPRARAPDRSARFRKAPEEHQERRHRAAPGPVAARQPKIRCRYASLASLASSTMPLTSEPQRATSSCCSSVLRAIRLSARSVIQPATAGGIP